MPTFSIVEDDDFIKMLHNFATFFMNNATESDMESVSGLLAVGYKTCDCFREYSRCGMVF